MIKSKAFQLVAVALAAGMLIGAAADRAISRLDARAMSDAEKNRQVRKDLLSILLPSKTLYSSNRISMDGDVWLHTRASATPYRTLCQRDTLLLYYGSIEQSGRYEERPALPYKLDVNRSYRFVGAPKTEYLTEAIQAEEPRSPFAGECRKADHTGEKDEWDGWFEAASPDLAMEGGFAMLALAEWAKQPANQFGNCIKDADPAQCKARAEYGLNLDQLGGVERCKPEKPDEACWVLGKYGTLFTIHAAKTDKPMQAADIRSVDYEDQIIVT